MTPTEFNRIATALYGSTFAPDIAKALGTTLRTVNRYMSGERGIPDDMRERLAKVATKRVAEITKAVAS